MQIGESVRTSAAEIWSHKLRSALTLVGIVLGTTALVVMVSVIGGLAVGVMLTYPQGLWGLIAERWDIHVFPVQRRISRA